MAKFELNFLDNYDENTIKVFEEDGIISIVINEIFDGNNTASLSICLDKSTAIKFAKTLRTEINKITEQEVEDGLL